MKDETNNIGGILSAMIGDDPLLINIFSGYFRKRRYKKDEYFLKEGCVIEKLGIIAEGVARTYTTDINGEEYNILISKEGGSITGSFVPESNSLVNIQFLTDAIVFEADFRIIIAFLEENEQLKSFFFNHLSRAHFMVRHKLTQYLRLDARGRYLAFLEEYPNLMNRIPHYHVANYLGITTTQLSRIRRKLASEGNKSKLYQICIEK